MTAVFFKLSLLNFLEVTLFVTGIYSIAARDCYISAVKGRCSELMTAVQFTTDVMRILTIMFVTVVTSVFLRNSLLTFLCLVKKTAGVSF